MTHMQNFLTEREALFAARPATNRPATELPPSLFGNSPSTVLKGSVIAESDQDLAQLFARRQYQYQHYSGLLTSRPQEAPVGVRFPESRQDYVPTSELLPTETVPAGSMMELEHVPKARLVVRHPVGHLQSSRSNSADLHALNRPGAVAMGGLGRSSSTPGHALMGLDSAALPSPYHPTNATPNTSMRGDVSNMGMSRHLMGTKGATVDPYLLPAGGSTGVSPGFDVSQLGSFRVLQMGGSMNPSPAAYPTQLPMDPFSLHPAQSFGNYSCGSGGWVDPGAPGGYYDMMSYPHPAAPIQDGMSVRPVDHGFMTETGRAAAPHQPFCTMIPTPRFVTGNYKQGAMGGGPIELPEQRMRTAESQNSSRSRSEKLSSKTQKRDVQSSDQSVLEFMDEILKPETSDKKAKPKKKPIKKVAKGKSIAKAKATKKTEMNKKKGLTNAKREVETAETQIQAQAPEETEVKTTLYDRIAAQQPDDGLSDASCLLWMPQLIDTFLQPFDRGNAADGGALQLTEHDDVNDVFHVLEDAGLETMPNEKNAIPHSCPILPSASQLSPTTPEDVLELAFCCLGKSTASVEELQVIMKSWLEVTGKGPSRNPGLELWKGLDHAKVFAQSLRGQESILTCLKKCTSRFQTIGLNDDGKETWECIDLGFIDKTTITTTSSNHSCEKSTPVRNTKKRNAVSRKRKNTAAASKPSGELNQGVSRSGVKIRRTDKSQ